MAISEERLEQLLNSKRRFGICVATVRNMARELLLLRRLTESMAEALENVCGVDQQVAGGHTSCTDGERIMAVLAEYWAMKEK